VALFVLHYRLAHGTTLPTAARFANAIIETSLPTVALWAVNKFTTPVVAFGTWPTMLYFMFIVASSLRLDFALPAFTGIVAAAGYLGVAAWVLSFQGVATNPNHIIKAALMMVTGAVAGLVALRLRAKFRRAVEEAVSRERVTNLFGQHVSPSVVDRLLDSPPEFAGDIREICVMFLDFRNFTEYARSRPPEAVVEFLNANFAFMIEAIDRHGGFINKFLGDGFMAIFGAPLDDPAAASHAVEAAQEILAETDERGRSDAPWPLRVGIGLHRGFCRHGQCRLTSSQRVHRHRRHRQSRVSPGAADQGVSRTLDRLQFNHGSTRRCGREGKAAGRGDGERLHRTNTRLGARLKPEGKSPAETELAPAPGLG
jgi:adenylate cyclase